MRRPRPPEMHPARTRGVAASRSARTTSTAGSVGTHRKPTRGVAAGRDTSRSARTSSPARVITPRTRSAGWRKGNATTGHGNRCGEHGGVTVEYAVLFPVLLVLLLGSVQAAMWWHTRNIALAAAQAGVNAGRASGAGPTQAIPAATAFAHRAADGLSGITVTTAGSTATTIRVQVSITAPRVLPIPGLSLRVTQTAVVGRERFTTPGTPP